MDEDRELSEAKVSGAVGKAIPKLKDVLLACEGSRQDYHLALATQVFELIDEFETIVMV